MKTLSVIIITDLYYNLIHLLMSFCPQKLMSVSFLLYAPESSDYLLYALESAVTCFFKSHDLSCFILQHIGWYYLLQSNILDVQVLCTVHFLSVNNAYQKYWFCNFTSLLLSRIECCHLFWPLLTSHFCGVFQRLSSLQDYDLKSV